MPNNCCQVSQVVRRPPRNLTQDSGCAFALRGSNPLPGAELLGKVN